MQVSLTTAAATTTIQYEFKAASSFRIHRTIAFLGKRVGGGTEVVITKRRNTIWFVDGGIFKLKLNLCHSNPDLQLVRLSFSWTTHYNILRWVRFEPTNFDKLRIKVLLMSIDRSDWFVWFSVHSLKDSLWFDPDRCEQIFNPWRQNQSEQKSFKLAKSLKAVFGCVLHHLLVRSIDNTLNHSHWA